MITEPSSTEEHAANYKVLLHAISSDVLEIPLGHISPRALAEGACASLPYGYPPFLSLPESVTPV